MPRTRKNTLTPAASDEPAGLEPTIPLPGPFDLTPKNTTTGRGRKKQTPPSQVNAHGTLEVMAIASEPASAPANASPTNALIQMDEQTRVLAERLEAAKKIVEESESSAANLRQEVTQIRQLHQASLEEFKTAQAGFHNFLQEFLEVRKLTQAYLAEVQSARESLDRFPKDEWTTYVQQSLRELVELRDQIYQLKEQVPPIRELTAGLPEALQSVQDARTELCSMNEDVQAFREEFGRIVVASRQLLSEAELEPIQDHLRELGRQLPQTEQRVHEIQEGLTHVRDDLREARAESLRVKEQVQHAPVLAETHETKVEELAQPTHLGLTIDAGVMIVAVLTNSPAEQAGLLQGDVIQAVNGLAVPSIAQFRSIIDDLKDGEEAALLTNQSGLERTVMVQLTSDYPEENTQAENRSRLGLTVDSCVIVVDIEPASPAATSGIEAGDIIVEVDGQPIATAAQLRDAVLAHVAGNELMLSLVRRGQEMTLPVLLA